MITLSIRRRLFVPLGIASILAALLGTSPARAAVLCSQVTVPVSSVGTGPPDLQVAATLCRPDWQTPRTVQLLVHGATYNRQMWDWSFEPETYSYVRAAVSQGYATLAVDRIGHGGSTHPPAESVTISSGTTALHGVVTALRAGTVGGIAFQKVLWVGHSMGAVHGYEYGGRYTDIDGYLFTGNAHFIKQSWLDLIKNSVQPSSVGPGYLTTAPGTRDDLYYRTSMANPTVIARDEATKGTLTDGEVQQAIGLTFVPPAQSPTQAIRVPVLALIGEFDNLVCGPPDGLTCTKANLLALEAPYFTRASRLDVVTVSGAGHSMLLHTNAPASHWAMINWARTVAPPT